ACLLGMLPLSWFNPYAQKAVLWTRERLSTSVIQFIQSLPLVLSHRDALWVHGSLQAPVEEYVAGISMAKIIFERFSFWLCFFGHTHLAEGYVYEGGTVKRISFLEGGEISLFPEKRYLINCGSVGQPRDGNPQASFGVYDCEDQKVIIRRVEYPVEEAASKILRAGLPEILAYRLWEGR
ncbi:MAG: metallophosphoesterase family protein, partial [Candidatus Caldatribacteriaceae bacterium]